MYFGSKVRIYLTFIVPQSDRKYSHTNSYSFAMTIISQGDHLTAGAWAPVHGQKIAQPYVENSESSTF